MKLTMCYTPILEVESIPNIEEYMLMIRMTRMDPDLRYERLLC